MRVFLSLVFIMVACVANAQPQEAPPPPNPKQLTVPPPGGWKPAPEHQGGRNIFSPSMQPKPPLSPTNQQKK